MPDYPITIPVERIASARIRYVSNVASTRSVFTQEKQSQRFAGEHLEFDVTFRPLRWRDAGIWRGRFAKLYGSHGTFLYGDPDYHARGPAGSALGTPLVDGGGQAINSETLNTKGWATGEIGVLLAGDYIQLGTGASARLHMVTDDVDSDTAGDAVVPIWPRLRSSPANDAPIVVAGAVGVFELIDNVVEFATDQVSAVAFALRIREAL